MTNRLAVQVLVVGDANVDLVLRGDVVPRFGQAEQLLDGADLVLGGSATITASGLARLGVATAVSAVLGDDRFGAAVRDFLAEYGVRPDGLLTREGAQSGLTVVLSQPHDRAILTLAGTVPLLRAADVRASVEALHPSHVHFAAYFLLPALAAELSELLAWLRARGVRTSLDTNWDPAGLWGGLSEVLPLVDVLLPNREELVAVTRRIGLPFETDEEAAVQLARLGPRIVVKAGAEGGWSVAADGPVEHVAADPIDVVDTTGAGDSFVAGYLAAGIHGVATERERLRWATVAGSLSATRVGGTTSQPTLDDLRNRVGS
jgi:sugar/nucleoside kinase (ribokinase family)